MITSGSDTYTRFRATENSNLTCIYVNNAEDANNFVGDYLNWEIDPTSTFVETECNILNIDKVVIEDAVEVYPNPTSDRIYVKNNKIKSISILNMLGQKKIENQNQNNIDLSNLSNGLYYMSVVNISGNKSLYKVIKE